MTVRWETTEVDGKDMRIYRGVPERPGPHPGLIVGFCMGGRVSYLIRPRVSELHQPGALPRASRARLLDRDAGFFHRVPEARHAGLKEKAGT